MGDTVYKAVKFCESNNIPIMRRGRTRVVVHAHIERKFPEVTDEIVYGGDDD